MTRKDKAVLSFLRSSSPSVPRIAARDAIAQAEAGTLTLLDVRDISELQATGKAAGALHVPLMLLASKADPRHPEHLAVLTLEQPVAIYCASGMRSQKAAEMMLALGYAKVYNLGSLGDWRAAGGKVVA